MNSGSDAKNARFGAKHFKNRQPYQTKVIEYAEYLTNEIDVWRPQGKVMQAIPEIKKKSQRNVAEPTDH